MVASYGGAAVFLGPVISRRIHDDAGRGQLVHVVVDGGLDPREQLLRQAPVSDFHADALASVKDPGPIAPTDFDPPRCSRRRYRWLVPERCTPAMMK